MPRYIDKAVLREQAEEILPALDPSLCCVTSEGGNPALAVKVLWMLHAPSDPQIKFLTYREIPVKNITGEPGEHLYEVMRGLARGGRNREMLDEALEARDRRERSAAREHEQLGKDLDRQLEIGARRRVSVYGKHDTGGGKD